MVPVYVGRTQIAGTGRLNVFFDSYTISKMHKNPYFNLIGTFWNYCPTPHRIRFIIAYVMFVIGNLIDSTRPLVLAYVINILQQGGADLIEKVLWGLGAYAGIGVVFWMFHGPARYLERIAGFQSTKAYADHLYKLVVSYPLQWHRDNHSGSTIDRITKSYQALHDFSNNGYGLIQTVISIIMALVFIIWIFPLGGIISVITAGAMIWVIKGFNRGLTRTTKEKNEKRHFFQAGLFDYVSNSLTIITLRMEGRTAKELLSRAGKIFPPFRENVIINEQKWFTNSILAGGLRFIIILAYVLYHQRIENPIMIGLMVALFQYADKFSWGFVALVREQENIILGNANLEAAKPILEAEKKFIKRATKYPNLKNWNTLKISNLDFRYEDEEKRKHHLKDINLVLEKGKKYAFVGASGSGKSTLMMILRGLYDSDAGILEIDGKVRDLHQLTTMTTLIPQDPEIFENTMEYNITVGLKKKEKEIKEAIDMARFSSVLKRLPKGIQSDIKEKGVNLSGGEKQRLALARGIFSIQDSSMILLDEPTSSVDTVNEGKIYRALFRKFSDRCIISAIHKLHLLKNFDHIYVFDNGKLVESGNFNQLIKQNGALSDLWREYENY